MLTMTPTHQPATFADMARRLAEDGFVPGPPPGLDPHAEEIDAAIVAEAVCPASCGGAGLEYRPYHRGREYRILGRCRTCNRAEEF